MERKTQFFKLSEWTSRDDKAPYPEEWVEERWTVLAKACDELRRAYGAPIRVTPNGGYRRKAFNASIGGAPRSQHIEGRAADLQPIGFSGEALKAEIDTLWELANRLVYEGKLETVKGLGKYPYFIHVDIRPGARVVRWFGKRTQS